LNIDHLITYLRICQLVTVGVTTTMVTCDCHTSGCSAVQSCRSSTNCRSPNCRSPTMGYHTHMLADTTWTWNDKGCT